MGGTAWSYQLGADGVGVLTLDVPDRSANTLSGVVLRELGTHLDAIERSPPKGLVLRSGKKGGFIAGADINESPPSLRWTTHWLPCASDRACVTALQPCPVPASRCCRAFALGGGMELALACTYRVGVDDGKLTLGLPEVQLGIHPGFGGTVRSVRLVGVRPAMDMMLTGKNIRGDKALRMGLVDRLVPADQAEAAARELITRRPPPHSPPLAERALSWPLVRKLVTPALLRQVSARARREHYPAPFALVDLWSKHGASGRAAYDAEALSIAHLFRSDTARNLVRVFQLQERLKALGGKAPAELPKIAHVHVVGAGLMGGDIAAWCALRGFTVTLQDRGAEYIEPAMKRAGELFAKRIPKEDERAAAAGRLAADVAGAGVPQADLVIEAIYENLEAKQALYASLLPRMKPTAILATNTSSLVLESLAQGMADPGRFVDCISSTRWPRCRWWKSSSRRARAPGSLPPPRLSSGASTSCPCPAGAHRASS